MITDLEASQMSAWEYAVCYNSERIATGEAWLQLPEDPLYWEEAKTRGLLTGADVIRRDLIQEYSDSYKEANGIRPRWMNFEDLSLNQIRDLISSLYEEVNPAPIVQNSFTPLTHNPFAVLRGGF